MSRTNEWTVLVTFAAAIGLTMSGWAGDYYWTNTLGGDFAGAGNWSPAGPPGAADNANFTNNAAYPVTFSSSPETANAYFDAPGGTVTQAVGAQTWTLTNSYIVGRDAAASATVWHINGTLAVTNSGGTAELKIGEAGKGYFSLTNSVVTADRLTLTNTASTLTLLSGTTLNTLHGSTITNWVSVVAGTWNIMGETNKIGGLYPNGGGTRVIATGAGTVVTGGDWYIYNDLPNNRVVITNGAKAYVGGWLEFGGAAWSAGGGFDVAGAGSLLSVATDLKNSRTYNNIRITDGGTLRIGAITQMAGYENMSALISGSGSVWSNVGAINMGWYGAGASILVTSGGLVYANNTVLGELYWVDPSFGYGNSITVAGNGSVYSNASTMSFNTYQNTLDIKEGGRVSLGSWLNLSTYGNYSGNNVVRVRDSGSLLQANGVYLGNGWSNITLTVSNNAALVSTNASGTAPLSVGALGRFAMYSGTVVTVDGLVSTGNTNAQILIYGGTLNVRSANVANTSALTIGTGSATATYNMTGGLTNWHVLGDGLVITNNAILTGVGTIQAGVTNYGTINPGGSAGQMTITGSLNLASSSALNMEIGGYTQGTEYDYVLVQGPLTLGGALNVGLTNGFDLTAATNGWTFTVMASTNLSGSFANAPNGAGVLRVGNRKLFVYYGAGSPYDPNQVVLSVQVVPKGTILMGAWLKNGCFWGTPFAFAQRRDMRFCGEDGH